MQKESKKDWFNSLVARIRQAKDKIKKYVTENKKQPQTYLTSQAHNGLSRWKKFMTLVLLYAKSMKMSREQTKKTVI